MAKILFAPVSVLTGLVAGVLGKKLFKGLWSLVDREQPPDPKRRDASWGKVVAALVLEGAIFRAVRGVVDRASRQAFSKATGSWPGEERPEAS
ncbi:MAG TPA: DUF4235 domain-containing protein [Solirubrobacteraceae bacterium]|jgi:hypothetical protein|nr:DUF4235 domain-containing protein [Solirubrobacteraceae bacterium]